jgi:VCBS repeat-containing protein
VYRTAGVHTLEALAAGELLTDVFTYQAAEAELVSEPAEVSITIRGVNSRPTADDDDVSVSKNSPEIEISTLLLEGDTDPDNGDSLHIVGIEAVDMLGSLRLQGNRVYYDAAGQFEALTIGEEALEVFRYTVRDRGGLTHTATVTVRVLGESDTRGDFDGDGQVDVSDVNLLCAAIYADEPSQRFDLTMDGSVNHSDFNELILSVLLTTLGDANLDGQFDSADLVLVFQGGLYEDRIETNSTWVTGDWNCDREFDSSDLVLAFQGGGYEAAPRVAGSRTRGA